VRSDADLLFDERITDRVAMNDSDMAVSPKNFQAHLLPDIFNDRQQ
jgi:hypothetical protein